MNEISGGFNYWENPPENEIKVNNAKEWYSAKPYNLHDGVKGEWNYIIEFDFDDDKKGRGYFYATDPSMRISAFIKNQNYADAYKEYRKHTTSFAESYDYKQSFMSEVIKNCGADIDKIKNAIEAVAKIENETPKFMAKLLTQTTQSEDYKRALEKGKMMDNEKQIEIPK